MKYVHTNIIAEDWKRLVDFYIQVFRCEIVPPIRQQSGEWLSKGTGVPNARLEGAHLRLPGHGDTGPTLEIYRYDSILKALPNVPNKKGLGHLAFEVDNVQSILEKMRTHGGESYGEIVEKEIPGVGKITFTYAKDPEGNLIELQHWED